MKHIKLFEFDHDQQVMIERSAANNANPCLTCTVIFMGEETPSEENGWENVKYWESAKWEIKGDPDMIIIAFESYNQSRAKKLLKIAGGRV